MVGLSRLSYLHPEAAVVFANAMNTLVKAVDLKVKVIDPT